MSLVIHHRCRPLAAAIDAALRTQQTCRIRALAVLTGFSLLGLTFSHPTNAVGAGQTYIVTTAGDPGPTGTLSLREAVELANASTDDTVKFDPSLVGSTITLANGEIDLTPPVTIIGPGADRLTVSGDDHSRIFNIGPSGDAVVLVIGLTMTHGRASDVDGGAITVTGRLALIDSVVSASTASRGAGISVIGGALYASGSTLSGNAATAYGGALYSSYGSDAELQGCTISGNSAEISGGGVFASGYSFLRLYHSLIDSNALGHPSGVAQSGGGIALNHASSRIINSTISGNFAPDGGGGGIGVLNPYSEYAVIQYSTIVGNATSSGSDNGIYSKSGAYCHIGESIVANNFSAANDDDLAGAFAVSYSLIKNSGTAALTGSGNVFGADPELGSLRANGGPTLTMLPAATSPAIDRIPAGGISTDQRFLPRAVHELADMGAVERQTPEVVVFGDGFDGS